jgi:hypothetical protein
VSNEELQPAIAAVRTAPSPDERQSLDDAPTLLLPAAADEPALKPQTHAAPVFVDITGRRRRWIRRGAIGGVTLVTAYGIVVALSFLGGPVPPNSLLPIPGIPGPSTPAKDTSAPAVALGGASATGTGSAGTSPTSASGGKAASSSALPSASPSASPSPTHRGRPDHATKSPSAGPTAGHAH